MKTWEQQVIVITGASSGTGRAIATKLASKQPILVLAARREHALEEVAAECRESGASVQIMVTDTRNANDVQHLAKVAAEITGSIDVWINNAGVLAAGALEDVPPAVNEQVILTNLVGYINGAHEVIPYFKQQGYGILFNNISVGGWFPTPYAAAYSASKFGLRGYSESLKGELSHYPDIHVVDLYPAFLDTPGIQHAANYTGKVIKPAAPVYDPIKVAEAIIKLIENPKSRKTIGAAAGFLKLAYALFPKLSRNITASVIRKYVQKAEPIRHTAGNTILPLEFGTSIHGGWDKKINPSKTVIAAAVLAAVTAGLISYNRSTSAR
ncbi:SDR family oxidoreductase [Flavitalea sp.]|nr:SDR family oxidoreductase [Flavitalea sp.]